MILSNNMATSAWGSSGPSAWASQVDEEEESGGTLGPPPPAPAPVVLGGADAFPSLGEVGKVSKKDKRKGKSVSVAEFQGGSSTARGTFKPSAARAQEAEDPFKNLPTGPRERGADEDDKKSGFGGSGGFRGGKLLF